MEGCKMNKKKEEFLEHENGGKYGQVMFVIQMKMM